VWKYAHLQVLYAGGIFYNYRPQSMVIARKSDIIDRNWKFRLQHLPLKNLLFCRSFVS